MITTKRISYALTHTLSENHFIPPEEFEIYNYCFHYIIDSSLYCIIFLIVALLCHEFLVGLLFTAMFLLLRGSGGGVHAPTEWMCTLSSLAIYLLALWAIPKVNGYDYWLCPVLYVISAIIMCLLAPVDHKNKRFSPAQKRAAKKRTILIVLGISILFAVLYLEKFTLYYRTLTICGTIVTISMILGTIINKLDGRH